MYWYSKMTRNIKNINSTKYSDDFRGALEKVLKNIDTGIVFSPCRESFVEDSLFTDNKPPNQECLEFGSQVKRFRVQNTEGQLRWNSLDEMTDYGSCHFYIFLPDKGVHKWSRPINYHAFCGILTHSFL